MDAVGVRSNIVDLRSVGVSLGPRLTFVMLVVHVNYFNRICVVIDLDHVRHLSLCMTDIVRTRIEVVVVIRERTRGTHIKIRSPSACAAAHKILVSILREKLEHLLVRQHLAFKRFRSLRSL